MLKYLNSQDAAGSGSKKRYTFLRFDVNLAQPNEEPYPLKGKSLLRAAIFFTRVTAKNEMLQRCLTSELPDPDTSNAVNTTIHFPETPSHYFVDKDGTIYGKLDWGFCSLPGELRNRIYNLALVPGLVYPHAEPISSPCLYEECRQLRKPDLSILGTNRQVRREAESIYYGLNHFVVARGNPWNTLNFFSSTGQKLITRLTVSFSSLDIGELDRIAEEKKLVAFLVETLPDASQKVKHDHIHDEMVQLLEGQFWAVKGSDIANMTALQQLTLDVTNAYCPHGCCRMAVDVALLLVPTNKFQKWYRKIFVIGAKDEKERLKVLAAANGGCDALRVMEQSLLSGEIGGEQKEEEGGGNNFAVGFW